MKRQLRRWMRPGAQNRADPALARGEGEAETAEPLAALPVVIVDQALATLLPALRLALGDHCVRLDTPGGYDDDAVTVRLVPPERAADAAGWRRSRPAVLVVSLGPRDSAEAVRCLEAGADGYTESESEEIAALVRALQRRRAWRG